MPDAGYARSTPLPPPVAGWRALTLPCQRCFNLHCACVTEYAQVEALQWRVRERHRKSVRKAAATDQWLAAEEAAKRRLAS